MASLMFLIAIAFELFLCVNNCSGTIFCFAPFECVGDTIVNSGHVSAYGYKSISGPTSSVDVTGSAIAGFYGAFSGYSIDYVRSVYQILGSGESSIMSSGEISGDDIDGFGSTAFALSTITSTDRFSLFGSMSAYGTTASLSGSSSSIYGAFSFANSVLNVDDDGGSFTLNFYGYLSGYNSIINCAVGTSCIINCLGKGCFGLSLNCPAGSSCPVRLCDGSLSHPCPIAFGATVPAIPADESGFVLDMTTISVTNANNCELAGAIMYGDSSNPATSGADIDSHAGNICCMGYNSCQNVASMTVTNGYDIVCGGAGSCSYPASIINTENSPNSGVYCGGDVSCARVIIDGTSSSGPIVCGGRSSCDSATINKGSNLYCQGSQGCGRSEINGVLNVYVTGFNGLWDGVVNTDGEIINVYMAGYTTSSVETVINCENGDFCNVYCKANTACENTIINAICDNYYVECDDSTGFTCPTINNDISDCADPTVSPTSAPTPFNCPDLCDNEPCQCDEVGGCELYHFKTGCLQCDNSGGYFRVRTSGDDAYNFPCMQCQEVFGNECLNCNDNTGCSQCASGYVLTYYDECGLNYCQAYIDSPTPRPTSNPVLGGDGFGQCPDLCNEFGGVCDCDTQISNCQVCNQGSGCGQCESGYFKPSNNGNYDCLSCNEFAGTACQFCQDGQGCGQCLQGYHLEVVDECGLRVCQSN